ESRRACAALLRFRMLLSRLTLCAGALLVTACASAPPVGEHSPPAGQWPAVVAGPGAVEVSALAFVPGGIVMAGRSVQGVTVAEQNVAVAPGPFLVALNEVGVPTWARTFETTGTATIEAIVVAPGPALLFVGSFEG